MVIYEYRKANKVNILTETVHPRLRKASYRFESSTSRLDGTVLQFWQKDGQTIIVHDYKQDGFEIYKPACRSNDVEKTLKAIGV
jgi:hypothetical protein